MYGMKPIAEMQYSDFMFPATNQIISEAAKIRYRSNNDWSCPRRHSRAYRRRHIRRSVSFPMSGIGVFRHARS